MSVARIAAVIALLALAACSIQRAQVAGEAKERMVGLSREQVLACMGAPASRAAEGATEVWSYASGDGHTTVVSSGDATVIGGPQVATAIGSSSTVAKRRFCTVNVVMAGGKVAQVNYVGPTGGLLTAGEQCAFAVANCVH